MKKIMAFIMAALLMGAFAGCKNAGDGLSQAEPGATPAQAVAEDTPAPESKPEGGHKHGQKSTPEPATESGGSSSEEGAMLTEEQAKEKALEHAGLSGEDVEFTEVKTDLEDGRQVYELEFYTDTYEEYEYEIDAYTGEVISYKSEKSGQGHGNGGGHGSGHTGLSGHEAKDLVVERVPGAVRGDIREFGRDSDNGRDVFEGKLVYDGMEYEFKIDAQSGEFLEWEQEPWDN